MVRQASFVESLSKLAREIRSSKDIRPKKINRLRAAINDPKLGLGTFPSIPLPLDARISIIGIDAEKSSIFKSNLFPFKLSLLCENGMEFPVIFKNGDDMRQDQLVIQLFTLMDRLLRKENLDLKLMMFKVLATGPLDGMVQFVPSKTVGDIVSEYGGSLLNYLREHSPDEGSVGTYGVNPAVLDTYIRSCGELEFCVSRRVKTKRSDGGIFVPSQPVIASSLTFWESGTVTSITSFSRLTDTSSTVGLSLSLHFSPYVSGQATNEALYFLQSTSVTYSVGIRNLSPRPSNFPRRWSTPWGGCSPRTLRGSRTCVSRRSSI